MFLLDASWTMLTTGGLVLSLAVVIRLFWRQGKPLEEP